MDSDNRLKNRDFNTNVSKIADSGNAKIKLDINLDSDSKARVRSHAEADQDQDQDQERSRSVARLISKPNENLLIKKGDFRFS